MSWFIRIIIPRHEKLMISFLDFWSLALSRKFNNVPFSRIQYRQLCVLSSDTGIIECCKAFLWWKDVTNHRLVSYCCFYLNSLLYNKYTTVALDCDKYREDIDEVKKWIYYARYEKDEVRAAGTLMYISRFLFYKWSLSSRKILFPKQEWYVGKGC